MLVFFVVGYYVLSISLAVVYFPYPHDPRYPYEALAMWAFQGSAILAAAHTWKLLKDEFRGWSW